MDVRQHYKIIQECFKRLPDKGPLYTSQSPPIFLLGIMSYEEEDRAIIRTYYEKVVANAGFRSVSTVVIY